MYLRKDRVLKAYFVNDPSLADKVFKSLFSEREKDPEHRKVMVALYEQGEPYPLFVHPSHQPVFNSNHRDADVILVLYDEKGNPVPIEALFSESALERSKIAQLYRYYIAQRDSYDYLARTVDYQRQLIAVLEDALAHRDAEVEALMNANRELIAIVNSISNEIQTMRFHILDMESKLKVALASRDEWMKVTKTLLSETFPALVDSLNKLGEEVSSEFVKTMRSHVRDLRRESLLVNTINELKERIKEQTSKIMELTMSSVKEEKKEEGEKESGGEKE